MPMAMEATASIWRSIQGPTELAFSANWRRSISLFCCLRSSACSVPSRCGTSWRTSAHLDVMSFGGHRQTTTHQQKRATKKKEEEEKNDVSGGAQRSAGGAGGGGPENGRCTLGDVKSFGRLGLLVCVWFGWLVLVGFWYWLVQASGKRVSDIGAEQINRRSVGSSKSIASD